MKSVFSNLYHCNCYFLTLSVPFRRRRCRHRRALLLFSVFVCCHNLVVSFSTLNTYKNRRRRRRPQSQKKITCHSCISNPVLLRCEWSGAKKMDNVEKEWQTYCNGNNPFFCPIFRCCCFCFVPDFVYNVVAETCDKQEWCCCRLLRLRLYHIWLQSNQLNRSQSHNRFLIYIHTWSGNVRWKCWDNMNMNI